VAVSCGAIPETLLEEELFGHDKGAFTGSVGPRPGSFEESANGTLFFDEIGELSLAAQVKLLRVLQEREFKRLGSNRLIPLRARLIFATHQNLDERVAQGLFRQDLYYRLDVVRISAPPLRDRPEDIALLMDHFLQMYARKFGLPLPEVDPDTLAILRNYPWPGNVRELEHVMESSLIVSRGEAIGPYHLPARFVQNAANIVDIGGYLQDGSFDEQLSHFKLKLAMAAVRQHNGNKTLAARSLNISRPYLHRLLRHSGSDQLESGCCSEVEAEAL
jgi:DNA-binding NtrC family response regulator